MEIASGVEPGIGTQAQIGAEDVAVLGALVQQAHQIARQAHEESLDLQSGAQAQRSGS